MQDSGLANGLLELHAVGCQGLAEPDPGLGEAAGADAQAEQVLEDGDQVAHADAEAVMQPGTVKDDVQAERRARQRRGDRGRDDLLAVTAPVAVDGVRMGLDGARHQILDETGVGADGGTDGVSAVGAALEPMLGTRVDGLRYRPAGTGVPRLAAGLARAPRCGRLLERGYGRRGLQGVRGGRLLVPLLGLVREFEDLRHGLLAGTIEQGTGLLASHGAGSGLRSSNRQRRVSGRTHTSLGTACSR